MKDKIETFAECVICKFWSSENRKYKNKYYCPKHIDQEKDKPQGIRGNKKFQKFLTNVQTMNANISSEGENVNNL